MAMILVEGFDHYSASILNQKFWNGFITGFVRTDTGRDGVGQCVVVQTLASISKQFSTSYSTVVAGASIKLSGLTNPFMKLTSTTSGLVAELGVVGGYLTLTDNAANTFTGTTLIPDNSWFQVEMKVTVGASAFEVRLNGATEITGTGSFGADNILTIVFTHAGFGEGATTRVDDVYVLDTTGSSPRNNFLGDVMVKTLYPAADATYTQWTPLTGSSHWLMVNEKDMDGDGSYVFDSTATHRDSYTMQAIGVNSTIYAAQLNLGARKGDAGLRQIAPFVRQSSTNYGGATATLSTDWLFYSQMMPQDPTGTNWTPTTLNGDEYGMVTVA